MDIFHKPFTLNEYSTRQSSRHGHRSNQRLSTNGPIAIVQKHRWVKCWIRSAAFTRLRGILDSQTLVWLGWLLRRGCCDSKKHWLDYDSGRGRVEREWDVLAFLESRKEKEHAYLRRKLLIFFEEIKRQQRSRHYDWIIRRRIRLLTPSQD